MTFGQFWGCSLGISRVDSLSHAFIFSQSHSNTAKEVGIFWKTRLLAQHKNAQTSPDPSWLCHYTIYITNTRSELALVAHSLVTRPSYFHSAGCIASRACEKEC